MRLTPRLVTIALLCCSAAAASDPVFRDDFSRHSSGWPHASGNRGFSIYTDTGKYQITPVDDMTLGIIPAPRQARSGDVRIEADLFMYAGLGAGASGLVCRQQDAANLYAFLLTGSPGWNIVKVVNGKPVRLAGGTLPRGVMAGAVDTRIAVECQGDDLRLIVGGKQIGQARDASFSTGDSGLMVMAENAAGTSATFDNFLLRDLASG
ncbi:MAG: hypothetical protein M3R16_07465, partial [Pseudomonadota bacterium]|nr:hypothetical protein [Pseudomonadota bacterium]